MARKRNTSLGNLIGDIIEPSTPAPHEAAAHDATATNEEVPVVSSEEKKSGRPKTITEEVAPLTVRLPKTLLHELKLRAVMEHTTQTEIIGNLIKSYLNK